MVHVHFPSAWRIYSYNMYIYIYIQHTKYIIIALYIHSDRLNNIISIYYICIHNMTTKRFHEKRIS